MLDTNSKNQKYGPRPDANPKAKAGPEAAAAAGAKDGRIPVDGFEQVFEMLKIADPAFRESLLKRLGDRDIELARSLRARLNSAGL